MNSPSTAFSYAARYRKPALSLYIILSAAIFLLAGCGSTPSANAIQRAIERSLFGRENHPWFALENFDFENGTEEGKNRYAAVVSYDIVLKKSGREILDSVAAGDVEGLSPDLLPILLVRLFSKVLLEGKLAPDTLAKGTRVHHQEKVALVKMDKGWEVASKFDFLYSR